MHNRRVEELRSSLHSQLEAYAARNRDRPNARLHWLSEQLENYVERWLAFRAAITVGSRSPPQDDLFDVIELATEMLTVEMRQLPSTSQGAQRWQRFLEVLSRVRTGSNDSAAEQLRTTVEEVRAALPRAPCSR